MTEVKEPGEATLPAKRKQFDPLSQNKPDPGNPTKNQKTHDSPPTEEETVHAKPPEPNENGCGQVLASSFSPRAEDAGKAVENEGESEDEQVDEDGEAVVVDRKGKGIMMEEEDEDSEDDEDEDDSSDDDGSDGGDDSELEDDPLAEVDLDNILPSRTRRRGMQPSFHLADVQGNEDDDDSDDSDA